MLGKNCWHWRPGLGPNHMMFSVGQTIVLRRLPAFPEGDRSRSAMVCPTNPTHRLAAKPISRRYCATIPSAFVLSPWSR
jgi:hypothetical protein